MLRGGGCICCTQVNLPFAVQFCVLCNHGACCTVEMRWVSWNTNFLEVSYGDIQTGERHCKEKEEVPGSRSCGATLT